MQQMLLGALVSLFFAEFVDRTAARQRHQPPQRLSFCLGIRVRPVPQFLTKISCTRSSISPSLCVTRAISMRNIGTWRRCSSASAA